MITAQGLGYTFVANDMASGPIQRLNANVKGLAKNSEAAQVAYNRNMGLIMSGTKQLLAGGAILMGMNSLTKAYGEFEYKLQGAGAVMGATASELRQLERAAIDAGIATQFSPTEAAAGLHELGSAGLKASDAIKTLNPVLDLAAASFGQLGIAEAATNVVGVLNAFGDTTDYARKRADQLSFIANNTAFQMRDFSVAISQAAAQASAADQSFESMTATLGILRNTNLDASSSATAYREAVRRLSGDKRSLRKLQELGINTLNKETGKIKDLGQIMAEVIPKAQALNAQERNLALKRIFGVRGMKTYNAFLASYNKLMKEGKVSTGDYSAAHRRLVEGLETSQGTAARTRDQLLKTSEGQRILMKGSIDTFKVVAGKALIPAILPALKSMTDALNKIIQLIDKIPKSITSFAASFAGAGATLLAFSGAVKLVAGARGLMALSSATDATAGGIAGMTARFKDSNKALRAMPLRQQMTSMQGLRTATRGFGQALGASIPYIGMAVAGLMAVHSMQKAKEEKEKARVKEIKEEQRRMRSEYIKTAQVVEGIGRAAARAGEKLIGLGKKKDLIEIQKRISENMEKARQAQLQLSRNIAKQETMDLSKKEKKELRAQGMRLIRERDSAREIVKQLKYVELQNRGAMIQRTGLWRRSENARRTLVASNQVRIMKMRQAEGRVEKQLDAAKKAGVKEHAKDLTKQLAGMKRRRELLTRTTAGIAGYRGKAAGAGKAIRRFAAPVTRRVVGFGDPTAATGLSQAELDYLVRGTMSFGQVRGRLSPQQMAAARRYVQEQDVATGGTYGERRAKAGAPKSTVFGEGASSNIGDVTRLLRWAGISEENKADQAGTMVAAMSEAIRIGLASAKLQVTIDGESVPTKKANTNARSARGQASQPEE